MTEKSVETLESSNDSLIKKIRLLTGVIIFLLILLAGAAFLWLKVKSKLSSGVVILSGTITDVEEKGFTDAYEADASGRGYRTALGGISGNYQGIYHRLDTLISQLRAWREQLGIDSVDFRFGEGPVGSKHEGKFTVFVVPLENKSGTWPDRGRYPYSAGDARTRAFDLGDLHP